MRLIFLSHDGNCNGGAQKCLLDLLKGIRQIYPEIELYVIFPYEGDFIKESLPYIDGYEIIPMLWWLFLGSQNIGVKQKIKFLNESRSIITKVRRYLLKINPDYAITNTIVVPYLAVACKLLRIKHYWFIHEIPSNTWSNNKFVFADNTIQECIRMLSFKIFVTSNYAKSYYMHRIPEKKLKVIEQAVELDLPVSPSASFHQRYTVLLVGTFDSNKGHLELLQAVNEIVVAGKDIFCYLVGPDAGTMDSCKEYVALHRLERYVSIVPFVADIWKFYYLADILVVCSTLETFGRVAVEAQKCGLPVILSNVGANPERIMDKVNGFLYEKGNLSDLVDKIETLRDSKIRKLFVDNITLLNLNRYSTVEFASHFLKEL
ncbi:glycosyltransferase family 4 protein [uncultured Bacteroides sp.]|uniref:glycosyltransferase family 4 protein n=1 Tax=uncultured Bacteroides sp. TaxID=162156 RepID=UPI0025D9E130|nr:glycosyltransferase family 4 protein [uncultured Bacteroides sp.]